MTAYGVAAPTANGSNIGATLAVIPSVTWPVRIVRIECNMVTGSTSPFLQYSVVVYTGATLSGGSSIIPFPMRRITGVPAALATAKSGSTISGGTNVVFHGEIQESTAVSPAIAYLNMNSSYSFPFDLIVASGSIIWVPVVSSGTTTISSLVVYFEELHLARSV